jgi:hypothetical protein
MRCRVMTAVALAMLVVLLIPGAATAGQWADQEITGQVLGEKAQLYTYDLAVHPDIHTSFTLSHVYMEYNYHGIPFVEAGVYKGVGGGSHPIDTDHPRYYRACWDELTGYHEGDDSNVPAINTYKYYRVANQGYDLLTGKDIWAVYCNDMVTPVDTLYMWNMPTAHAVCGGECTGSGTVLKTHAIPDVNVRKQNGTSYAWNETNFPGTYKDLYYSSWTLTWPNSPDYQTFTASGTHP